jgi:hypothetical protein
MLRTLAIRVTSQIATRFRLWRQEVSYPVILQSMIQLNYILPINRFYLIKHNKFNTNKTNCQVISVQSSNQFARLYILRFFLKLNGNLWNLELRWKGKQFMFLGKKLKQQTDS